MSVPFRFDTVLRIRETERDVKRQALALGQAQKATLRAERDRIAEERLRAQDELRALQATDGWTAEAGIRFGSMISLNQICSSTFPSSSTSCVFNGIAVTRSSQMR